VSEESAASVFMVEDGGNRIFRNVGTYIPNYTASHPRENLRRRRLNVLEEKILWRIFIRKKKEMTEDRRK
jgi:hypothetical protein